MPIVTFTLVGPRQADDFVEESFVISVEQIESAILQLPPDDFRRLADWLQQQADQRWDEQIEADIRVGKLDALADEALAQYRAGQFRTL